MKNVFSDNDLLLFLYDEMAYERANELVKELAQDEELLAGYEYFQRSASAISFVDIEPPQEAIDAIMSSIRDDATLKKTQSGSFRTALLTGMCAIAFLFAAFAGNWFSVSPAQSSKVAVSVANEALWDDASFSNQINNLESRTKALQDPIL
jgi:hypothetical protein